MWQTLTVNIKGKPRSQKVKGREYYVATANMIVPGVLKGSAEALYYPPEECEKSVNRWNGIGIVVYHPTLNGIAISARTPEVFESAEIGRVFNTQFGDLLFAEAWFDVEKTRLVDERVLNMIEEGQQIEISTGLYVEKVRAEKGSKDDKGREYSHIATNFQPDHLAILPDQVGACSIKDGCGVVFNTAEWKTMRTTETRNRLTANAEYAKSYEDRRMELSKALEVRYGYGAYITDLYDSYIVFSFGNKMWKLSYSEDDGSCTLSDEEPKKVKRITHYEEVNNSIQNLGGQTMPLTRAQRGEIISHLTTNCECWQGEGDDEILNGFNDEKLLRLKDIAVKELQAISVANAAVQGFRDGDMAYRINPKTGEFEKHKIKNDGSPGKKESVANVEDDYEEDEEEDEPKPKKKKAPTANSTDFQKPKTREEWLRSAPPDIREIVENAKSIEEKEKSKIIGLLLVNVSEADKTAHRERLMKRPLHELAYDLEMMPKPVETIEEPKPTTNKRVRRVNPQDTDLLNLPRINWSKEDEGKPVINTETETEYEEVSEDDWMQNAPQRVRQQVMQAQAIEANEKRKLIQEIVSNVKDEEQADLLNDQLQRKSLEELKIIQIAQGGRSTPSQQSPPRYFGANTTTPTANRSVSTDADILPLPKMEWEVHKKK